MDQLFSELPSHLRQQIFDTTRGRRLGLPEQNDPRIQEATVSLKKFLGIHCVHGFSEFQPNPSSPIEGLDQLPPVLVQAGFALKEGAIDAVVAGVTCPTAQVIRTALKTVGLSSQTPIITSCFLMALAEPTAGGQQIVLYADCGVVPQPSASKLAQIAVLGAEAFTRWVVQEPRVAFLSFSTANSAEHAEVKKMQEAYEQFKILCPDVLAEGELQFDAATVPDIARRKNPSSVLQGTANVFIFPNLDAGNIAYKVTQRLAKASAWGPILLGLNKPFSDLSRGASPEDIVHVALLTLALGAPYDGA